MTIATRSVRSIHTSIALADIKVSAVVFDVDGTLIDPASMWHAVRVVCGYAADRYNLTGPGEVVAAYRIAFHTAWNHFASTLAPLGSAHSMRRYVWHRALATVGVEPPERHLDQLVEEFLAAQLDAIHPDPYLPGLLRALADRFPLGVASNGTDAHTRAKLGRAGIRDMFTAIDCGLDDQVLKPDKELFFRSCRALAVEPSGCLYVGDDWKNDVIGARNAGLHPVWVQQRPTLVPLGPPPLGIYPTANDAVRDILRLPTSPALHQHAPKTDRLH